MRIAATADIHLPGSQAGDIAESLRRAGAECEVLILAGDLTNLGHVYEMEFLLGVLKELPVPVVAVLGNHEFESGRQRQLAVMMSKAGVYLLNGSAVEVGGIGFAGTKGFPGGYGRWTLAAFGEPEIKAFVQAAVDESLKLESALSALQAQKKVVVLHYSPITGTLVGENPEVFPYLGTSRLAEVIDRFAPDLVVHGHAHRGSPEGWTPGGVPVRNVSLGVLGETRPYALFDL